VPHGKNAAREICSAFVWLSYCHALWTAGPIWFIWVSYFHALWTAQPIGFVWTSIQMTDRHTLDLWDTQELLTFTNKVGWSDDIGYCYANATLFLWSRNLSIHIWFPSPLNQWARVSHADKKACTPLNVNWLFFIILRRKIVVDNYRPLFWV